eukprot:TRINITY_DN11892_c0_g2_i1.p1 TRINITY_DN11892_c0_g2~~TRINITY_DN11892_c0_g2_i1.p1  ORF type:complete len:389 (+),score=86.46 TRINITY_DN11892_c0_g2_i1:136-1167(+)
MPVDSETLNSYSDCDVSIQAPWDDKMDECLVMERGSLTTAESDRQTYWRCWYILRWARIKATACAMYEHPNSKLSPSSVLEALSLADVYESTNRSNTEPFDPTAMADRVLAGPVDDSMNQVVLYGKYVSFPARLKFDMGRHLVVHEIRAALSARYGAVPEFDVVAEVGAGWSQNLFQIMLSFPTLRKRASFYAGEYSPGGRGLGELIASRSFPEVRYAPFPFDYNAPDTGPIAAGESCFVYTCHSIEQIHMVPGAIVDEMLRCGTRRVFGFHFEPINFQLSGVNPMNAAVEQMSRAKSTMYNTNLVSVLHEAERAGHIKILGQKADVWEHGSVIFWEKQAKKV